MVSAIGLPRLAFLAEADLAIALDRERGRLRGILSGEETVAIVICRRAGVREDSGCV